jgi:type VI secretion system protein ImpA
MPIPLDRLLAPVSPENPCGPDVSYDPEFQELETLLLGKPETQFSAAEPPEWSQIRGRCLDLLARSKHLRMVVTLSAALLRTEGLAGFRDSLTLLESVIRQYWDSVYPLLDPEDGNDPTERLNIVAALTTPIGVVGDPYQIVEGLRHAPLSASPQMGRFSLHDFQRSQSGQEEAGKPATPLAQVEASFRDTPPEQLSATLAAVTELGNLVKSLSGTIGERIGADRVPNFDQLTGTLRELQKTLAPYVAGTVEPEAAAPADMVTAGGVAAALSANSARAGFSGGVNTREEVLRALDAILRYYSQNEPSSPVPLLLERAKRIVPMDFLAIVKDWVPDSVNQVNLIAGIRS